MSFQRYERYRDVGSTWFGNVPDHWGVFDGRRIFAQKRDASLVDDPQLSATQKYGVIPQTLFMELEGQKVVLALKGTDAFKHVEIDDFIISLRSFQGGIEKSHYRGCVSTAYTVLRNAKSIDAGYWEYLFKSSAYIAALSSVTDGIREGRSISYAQFGSLPLPLPSVSEQANIASFLDHETLEIDALIEQQLRLIQLLNERRQAVISHVVTKGLSHHVTYRSSKVEELADTSVPSHWKVVRVKHVSKFTTSGPRGWSERISEAGSIFVQSGDLNGALQINFDGCKRVQVEAGAEADRTHLKNGDIVVCITGAKTGNVAVCENLNEPAYVNQHLCLIRANENILPRFLGLVLKSRIGQTHFEVSQYGLKQGLSLEDVREAPVFLPSLTEQKEILRFLDSDAKTFSLLYEEAEAAIHLLQERRSALIAAAVTGKIDVRNYIPKEGA